MGVAFNGICYFRAHGFRDLWGSVLWRFTQLCTYCPYALKGAFHEKMGSTIGVAMKLKQKLLLSTSCYQVAIWRSNFFKFAGSVSQRVV